MGQHQQQQLAPQHCHQNTDIISSSNSNPMDTPATPTNPSYSAPPSGPPPPPLPPLAQPSPDTVTGSAESIPFLHKPLIEQHHQHVLQQMAASFSANMSYIDELKKQHNISSFTTTTATAQNVQTNTKVPQIPQVLPVQIPNEDPHAFNFDAFEKFGKSQNRNINELSLNLNPIPIPLPLSIPIPVQMPLSITNINEQNDTPSPVTPTNTKKRKLDEIDDGGNDNDLWTKRPRLESFEFTGEEQWGTMSAMSVGEPLYNLNHLQMFDPENQFGASNCGNLEQFDCSQCQKKFMLRADFDSHFCKKQTQFMLSPPRKSDIMPKINEN